MHFRSAIQSTVNRVFSLLSYRWSPTGVLATTPACSSYCSPTSQLGDSRYCMDYEERGLWKWDSSSDNRLCEGVDAVNWIRVWIWRQWPQGTRKAQIKRIDHSHMYAVWASIKPAGWLRPLPTLVVAPPSGCAPIKQSSGLCTQASRSGSA